MFDAVLSLASGVSGLAAPDAGLNVSLEVGLDVCLNVEG
jgi:hypothetical protein